MYNIPKTSRLETRDIQIYQPLPKNGYNYLYFVLKLMHRKKRTRKTSEKLQNFIKIWGYL